MTPTTWQSAKEDREPIYISRSVRDYLFRAKAHGEDYDQFLRRAFEVENDE